MAKIIGFNSLKEMFSRHVAGEARCLSCDHNWAGVAKDVQDWLECPKCHRNLGRLINHVEKTGEMHWTCSCGNDLFYIQPNRIYCPNCGETQEGF
jgi:Zn finger protein HypA/HybF involved in hydrogenase expression